MHCLSAFAHLYVHWLLGSLIHCAYTYTLVLIHWCTYTCTCTLHLYVQWSLGVTVMS